MNTEKIELDEQGNGIIDDVISRLSSLKRKDIDKYKSTPKKEELVYSNYENGRFILWQDVKALIDELNGL